MTTEIVPLCTERFALEQITKTNDELADELYGALKLLADFTQQFDQNEVIAPDLRLLSTHLHVTLRQSATITGFIHMAGIK